MLPMATLLNRLLALVITLCTYGYAFGQVCLYVVKNMSFVSYQL